MDIQRLTVAQVHVHAAGEARIEAPHGPHDVDALELVWAVFLEDRGVLPRVLVRARSPVGIADAAVPRRRRIRVIVGDLSIADYHMVRQNAAHGFMESAANRFVRYLELAPRLRAPGMELGQCLFDEIIGGGTRVDLKVGTGPIALDRVAPLGNLPLELSLG